MAEAIIDGTGSGNYWRINSSGAGLVVLDAPIVIGSVSVAVDTVYVQSGVTFVDTRRPTLDSWNPGLTMVWSSGVGVNGSQLTQVIKGDGAGSVVQDLSWTDDTLTNVGSWY